jgi:Ca2+-binding RTX toxin-like protein
VAIANNPGIVDDAVQMVSARIVLTNAQPDDELNVGTLPAGISANVATVNGQIIVTLTGSASLAAYQRAIQAVTFDNDSQNPVAGNRVIQVTVNDGLLDSNVATTTINVVATNDPPNAENDIVFTNVATGPFLIPEWALLANDTDIEGDTLDITAVNGNNAFQASLTANPGSVTLTDVGNPGGTFSYTASDGKGGFDTTTVNVTRDTTGAVEGNQFDNILIGNASGSTFDASTGNDTILAGGGDDTIVWNANNFGATDGTDFVDGGSGTDTFDLNTRPGQNEVYRVYTRAEAILRNVPVTRDDTEIVITRTVGNATAVVAELDNIEEIRIGTQTSDPSNGSAGPGDTVQIFGDFSTTSLALNTITIDGNAGNDTVDISGLTSAHRIVFRSRGGNDTIVGTLRPQDVIELEPGRKVEEYEWEDNEDGSTTITCGVHQVTFRCEEGVQPTLAEVPATPEPVTPVEPVTPPAPVTPADPAPVTSPEPVAAADLNLKGSSRSETLRGDDGHDRMDGGRGHDKLYGGAGNDRLHGGDGHDRLDGGTGADRMWGGRGNDVYIVDDRGDRVFEGRGHGIDTVKASVSYSISGTHVEKLILRGSENLNGTGNGLDNLLVGNSGNNVLKGGRGEDTLRGKSGDDVLSGGAGDDRLTGGSGADTFVFQKGGGRDVVTDFRHGQDDIDVSRLNGVNSLSDLDIRQEGGNTIIEHGNSVLVLKGVNASDLDSNDFIF